MDGKIKGALKFVTDNANVLSVILAFIAIIYASVTKNISKLIKYVIRIVIRPNIKSLMDKEIFGFSYDTLLNAKKYFIDTKFQGIDPAIKDEPNENIIESRESVIDYFDRIINDKDNNKYFIILAGTGMGKTTLMINLYFKFRMKKFNKYKIVLMPIQQSGQLDVIGRIKLIRKQSETILLLDALDEDLKAQRNYQERLNEITQSTCGFYKVIMTCRTHFFSSEKDEPRETYAPTFDTKGKYHLFQKMYLSPFSDKEVDKYIKSRYKGLKRKMALQIAMKCPKLTVRPMVLCFIDDLICDNVHSYENVCEIYEKIIESWIKREGLDRNKMNKFLSEVAVYMYNRSYTSNSIYLNENELEDIVKNCDVDISMFEAKTRSILNRNPNGELKFSHKSFYEYLIAVQAINNSDFSQYVRFDNMEFSEEIFEEYLNTSVTVHQKITNLRIQYEKSDLIFEKLNSILNQYDELEKELGIITINNVREYVIIKADLALLYFEFREFEMVKESTDAIIDFVDEYDLEDYKILCNLLQNYWYSRIREFSKVKMDEDIYEKIETKFSDNPRMLCFAFRLLAQIYIFTNRYNKAIEILEKVINRNEIKLHISLISISNIYGTLEATYWTLGAYHLSKNAYDERISEHKKNYINVRVYNVSFHLFIKGHVTNGLRRLPDKIHEDTINTYKKQVSRLDDRFKRQKWACMSNIGKYYEKIGKFDKALSYYNDMKEYAKESIEGVFFTNIDFASYYFSIKEYEKGLEILELFENSDTFSKGAYNKYINFLFYYWKGRLKKEIYVDGAKDDFYKSIEYLKCDNNENAISINVIYWNLLDCNIDDKESLKKEIFNNEGFLYGNMTIEKNYMKWISIANNAINLKQFKYLEEILEKLSKVDIDNIIRDGSIKNLENFIKNLIGKCDFEFYSNYLKSVCNNYKTYKDSLSNKGTENIGDNNKEVIEYSTKEDNCRSKYIEECCNILESKEGEKGKVLCELSCP